MSVDYRLDEGIALLTMDDGKANALSPEALDALHEAFDRAEADGAVVVLAGRPGVFCGGFHLPTLTGGGLAATALLRSGFTLARRMLSFPTPVVVASTGHAVAMGSFLLLAADLRIGAAGAVRVQANEVAIGMTMPGPARAMLRHRLDPARHDRAVLLAAPHDPAAAVAAGFLDEVVAAEEVVATATAAAAQLKSLHMRAHHATKLAVRKALLEELDASTDAEFPAA